MRTTLYTVPTFYFEQPQGVPRLVPHLRQRGHDVDQVNLNYLVYREALSAAHLRRVLEERGAEPRLREFLAEYDSVDLIGRVDEANRVLDERFGTLPHRDFSRHLKTLDRGLALLAAAYHPTVLSLRTGLSMARSPFSSTDISHALEDRRENPLIALYERLVLPRLKQRAPDVVGISMAHMNQFIPGFTLARLIKRHSRADVVLGGPAASQLCAHFADAPGLHGLFASLIIGPGEEALHQLLRCLEQDGDLSDVANCQLHVRGPAQRGPEAQPTLCQRPLAGDDDPGVHRAPATAHHRRGGRHGLLLGPLRLLRPDAGPPPRGRAPRAVSPKTAGAPGQGAGVAAGSSRPAALPAHRRGGATGEAASHHSPHGGALGRRRPPGLRAGRAGVRFAALLQAPGPGWAKGGGPRPGERLPAGQRRPGQGRFGAPRGQSPQELPSGGHNHRAVRHGGLPLGRDATTAPHRRLFGSQPPVHRRAPGLLLRPGAQHPHVPGPCRLRHGGRGRAARQRPAFLPPVHVTGTPGPPGAGKLAEQIKAQHTPPKDQVLLELLRRRDARAR